MTQYALSTLSDDKLIAEVDRLVRCHRDVTAELVAHLAELESRRLHLAAGFPSLFAYCTRFLRLSEYGAFNRIETARAARRFPRVLTMLADGSLTLTTAQLVGRHLTDDNQEALLSGAAGKSKLEVQELLARHQPRPDMPASVRKLPVPPPAPRLPLNGGNPHGDRAVPSPGVGLSAATPSSTPAPAATGSTDEGVLPAAPSPARYRPPVTPLAPDRYQFTFTGNRETRELLDLAKDMLSHAVPDRDTGAVMNRALEALVRDLARKKFAATSRPRKQAAGTKDPQDVSAAVKREVWIRDRGRCAYIARDGRRCGARAFLEFHHLIARARGGPATVENIELRCRNHNDYEAERVFGERRPRGEWDTREARPAYGPATRSGTSGAAAATPAATP
jgi:5-methylcytosine-specific restriction endonuclease McrA